MSNFLVISYYTKSYKKLAFKLKDTILNHNLEGRTVFLSKEGTWQENTNYKPRFIKHCLKVFEKPILYVDADAEFRKYPELIPKLVESNLEFGCYYHNDNRKNELLSGTLFFKPTNNAYKLIDIWIKYVDKYSHEWEQENLSKAVKDSENLKIALLPQEYCCIFDCKAMKRKEINPIIIHKQASRQFRNKLK